MNLRYRRETGVFLAWLALLALLAAAAPSFYSTNQFRTLFVNAAPLLIAAIGTTVVLLARQIDISVGAVFSVSGVLAGLAAQAGWPMPLVAVTAILSGTACGALNGLLVAVARLPAIVVTLSTLVALRETLRFWREGEFVRNLPAGFQWFGLTQDAGQWAIIISGLCVWTAAAWGLSQLAGGRAIYATGSDPEAARLAGIGPRRVIFATFTAAGELTGLASLLSAVRFADVDPSAGNGLEMQAIAAVVVGGTSVTGGRGTLLGTLFGVLLLSTIGPALVFLHVQPQWERAIQGLVILVAVATDSLFKKP
jgi:rhamnose transport system permease protein